MKPLETNPLMIDPCQAVVNMGQVIQGTLGRESGASLRRYVPANVQEDGKVIPDDKGPPIYLRESRFAQWRSVLVSAVVIIILLYWGTKTTPDVSNLMSGLKTGLDRITQERDAEIFNTTPAESLM